MKLQLVGTNISFLNKGIDIPIFFPSVFINYRLFRAAVVAAQTGNTFIAKDDTSIFQFDVFNWT